MTGGEDVVRLRKKLGEEKFEMAIQMYNYFEDILRKGSADEDISQKFVDEQSAQLLVQLQQEVYSLKHRLEELEKARGIGNEMTL